MRVFVTGGTGFIGGSLIPQLVASGHEVTALVRGDRSLPGVRTIHGDLTQPETWRAALPGQDAVIHLAAIYRIGQRDRSAMYAVNVLGTRAVLDAAIDAGVARVVHVSSTAALGDSAGREAGEDHRHDGTFRTYYEETKHIAHGIALARIASGARILIAVPGGVFGAGDPSVLATTLRDCRRGKLPFQIETASRFQLCHVSTVCAGLIAVLERGSIGHSYLLTGASVSMPELIARVSALAGRAPPKAVSPRKLRWLARLCDELGAFGVTLPLSREALRLMDGSTYVYRSDKARRELGWDAGDVDAQLEQFLHGL